MISNNEIIHKDIDVNGILNEYIENNSIFYSQCCAQTIAGGECNRAFGNHVSIGGGYLNSGNKNYSTIAGGIGNNADGINSSIGGGFSNYVSGNNTVIAGGCRNTAIGCNAFIGGGEGNYVRSTLSSYLDSTVTAMIAGGARNCSLGAVIVGGSCNYASGATCYDGNDIIGTAAAFVGGGVKNRAAAFGAIIVGGLCNSASGTNSILLGGCCNTVLGRYDIIGGGLLNYSIGDMNGILGGCCNYINVTSSFIGGGLFNQISGGFGGCSFIGAGASNKINRSNYSAIVGGQSNLIDTSGNSYGISFIGAGYQNQACCPASIVVGGWSNTAINGIVVGGSSNFASGAIGEMGSPSATLFPIVGGGIANRAIGAASAVVGGARNSAVATNAFVGGGCCNTASGSASVIGGGRFNCILSQDSYIIGGVCNIVQASHTGAAILGDGQSRQHFSSGAHALTLDFQNGIYFAKPSVFGQINFNTRPKVGGTNVMLEGDPIVGATSTQTFTIPTEKNSQGTKGTFALSGNFLYFCKENNQWVRTALAEW